MKHLRHELIYAKEEIKRIQSVPLVMGQFVEMVNREHAVVNATNDQFYVRVLSTLNREKLFTDCSVGLHKHSHSIVEILPPEADSSANSLTIVEKPNVRYTVLEKS